VLPKCDYKSRKLAAKGGAFEKHIKRHWSTPRGSRAQSIITVVNKKKIRGRGGSLGKSNGETGGWDRGIKLK